MQDGNYAWRILADAARRMLSGELSFLDGTRIVLAQRRSAGIDDHDPDLTDFVLIDSETDHLPIGPQRAHWSTDALQAKEPEMRDAEAWARRIGETSAERLLERYAQRIGETDRSVILPLLARRAFFDRYKTARDTCPCCGYPTLDGRANYEICFLCWWEDDGQDDDSATVIFGGPNHDYSLRDARANFARSGVMYSQGREQDVVKQRIVRAFDEILHAPIADHARLWQVIAEDEQLLAGMSSHHH